MAENQSITAEEWRPVVGYESLYDVSSLGKVRSYRRAGTRGGLLAQHPDRWGYFRVKLLKDAQSKTYRVHLLVVRAFIGPCPDGMETRHFDDDKTHNYISNLAYGTKSENAQDRLRNGHHNHANKTHCPQGHAYDAANTRIAVKKDGSRGRFCLTCKREKIRLWRQSHRVIT